MPLFLTRQELYRVIQRELPEYAYPDGAPSAYYSTADSDATAKVIASMYENLETIYDNYWPQYADEKLAEWELTVFGEYQDSSVPVSGRIDKILIKLRSQNGITIQDMIDITKGVIGSDKEVEIAEWGCSSGAWVLGESQLGVTTILGHGFNRFQFNSNDPLCIPNAATLGITEDDLTNMQIEAYTFEVRIYNYTLTSEEETLLDNALTVGEPARSTHIITDGLADEDKIDGDT